MMSLGHTESIHQVLDDDRPFTSLFLYVQSKLFCLRIYWYIAHIHWLYQLLSTKPHDKDGSDGKYNMRGLDYFTLYI